MRRYSSANESAYGQGWLQPCASQTKGWYQMGKEAITREMRPSCLRAKVVLLIFVTLGIMSCFGLLVSCTGDDAANHPVSSKSAASALSGDSALPELDGDYAYVKAEVVSKDQAADVITVKVLPWDGEATFVKSSLTAGSIGAVSCGELPFYPAGINEGTIVSVACFASDADAFPVAACSIERLDWFEERVARWATGS